MRLLFSAILTLPPNLSLYILRKTADDALPAPTPLAFCTALARMMANTLPSSFRISSENQPSNCSFDIVPDLTMLRLVCVDASSFNFSNTLLTALSRFCNPEKSAISPSMRASDALRFVLYTAIKKCPISCYTNRAFPCLGFTLSLDVHTVTGLLVVASLGHVLSAFHLGARDGIDALPTDFAGELVAVLR